MITRERIRELADASRRRTEERKKAKRLRKAQRIARSIEQPCKRGEGNTVSWLNLLATIMILDEIERRL